MGAPAPALEDLLRRRPDIWLANRAPPVRTRPGLSTGFTALDALLPDGGWPAAGLVDLVTATPSALNLILPLAARLGRAGREILWVAPPLLPYAPALAAAGLDLAYLSLVPGADQAPWAAEQGLRSGACGLVVLWTRALPQPRLRRLQLAAEEAETPLFRLCPPIDTGGPTPARLRLEVQACSEGLNLRLTKARGLCGARPLRLPLWKP